MIVINARYENYYNLIETLERFSRSTDTISADLMVNKTGTAVFIDEDEYISDISQYSIGRRIATRRNYIKFTKYEKLTKKISKSELMDAYRKHRSRIEDLFQSYTISVATPKTGHDIWQYILDKNEDLESLTIKKIEYADFTYPNVELEWEAISLPLKLSGITDISFNQGHPTNNISLFENIENFELIEDQLLALDFSFFQNKEDWDPAIYTAREINDFESGKRVSVFYANRTKLEHLIGVDLIIFNKNTNAYIFIQYKRMVEENEQMIYRIDKQMHKEIELMTKLNQKLSLEANVRLKSDPFYLKFCPSKQDQSVSNGKKLTKGIIIPLGNYLYLYEGDHLKTERGAQIVTYKNVTQYLDNTLFIDLYQNGWIGSGHRDTELCRHFLFSCVPMGAMANFIFSN
jgi:hypothetical protein